MFQFLTPQQAQLMSFTGRTEVHGKDRVPAVSFRLRFSGPNTLLDLLSPTLRPAFYTAAEGQEVLPGVEPSTPNLRSKDVTHLALGAVYEGWTVHIEHGIDESTHLEMGNAKIDSFSVDFHDGGSVDIECRVSTSDVDALGAGLLWSKQLRTLPVCLIAPKALETNPEAGKAEATGAEIDGTQAAFERDHPPLEDDGQQSILDAMQRGEPVASSDEAGPADREPGDDGASDGEGSDPDAEPEPRRGPAWPFPEETLRQQRAAEVAQSGSYDVAVEQPKTRGRRKAQAVE